MSKQDVNPAGAAVTLRAFSLLTIQNASDFRDALLDALGRAARVVVDLSQVSEVDLTGLQLLCSGCRSASAAAKSLAVSDPSEAFVRAAGAAGFIDATGRCIWESGGGDG